MSAGTELRRYRNAAELSQQQLAELLGVSLPIVSRWERGANVPRRDMAKQIDAALNAEGALLVAFGYAAGPDPTGTVGSTLESRLAALEDRVQAIHGSAASDPSRVDQMQSQLEVAAQRLDELTEALGHLAALVDAAARLRVAKLSGAIPRQKKPTGE